MARLEEIAAMANLPDLNALKKVIDSPLDYSKVNYSYSILETCSD